MGSFPVEMGLKASRLEFKHKTRDGGLAFAAPQKGVAGDTGSHAHLCPGCSLAFLPGLQRSSDPLVFPEV